jgi:alkaline phosphatase
MKTFLLLFFLIPAVLSAAETVPKNIILFIGDGMGVQQLTAGKIAKGSLEIERCPVSGLVTTWSANHLVTDSAAAATAIASGHKTNNGMLGLSPDGQALKNIVEFAGEKGKSTGVAAVCAVTHATPAGFVVHVSHRKQPLEIADQLAVSDIDVLFGGGLHSFTSTNGACLPNLQKQMPVARTAEEFRQLGATNRAAALLWPRHPPSAAKRIVSLKEMAQKAIEILSRNPEGFFLMVEGSQIDWAGHKNDVTNLVNEVVDFDDAVGAGLDFAEANGETLVIVTADHETGGFAVLNGSLSDQTISKSGFVNNYHTASMVPLFAFGPGSTAFCGMMDNTDIGKTMIRFIQSSEK